MSLTSYLVERKDKEGTSLIEYNLLALIGWVLIAIGLFCYGILYFHVAKYLPVIAQAGIIIGGVLVSVTGRLKKVIYEGRK